MRGMKDPRAIHVATASEIYGIAEKVTPISTDVLVMEDSAAGYVKKRVTASNLVTTLAPSGSGWTTLLDTDFSAQPSQNLFPDGNYTIGGVSWTKINTASEASGTVVSNGSGIIFTPAAGGTNFAANVRNLPALTLNISSLLAAFSLSTPIRITTYISSCNSAADYDNAVMAIETPSGATGYTSFQTRKGWHSGGGGNCAYGAANVGNTLLNQSFASVLYAKTVHRISFPLGLENPHAVMSVGTYAAGFPTDINMTPFCVWQAGGGFYQYGNDGAGNTGWGTPGQWNILLGAMKYNSGTVFSCTFARLKIEYKS